MCVRLCVFLSIVLLEPSSHPSTTSTSIHLPCVAPCLTRLTDGGQGEHHQEAQVYRGRRVRGRAERGAFRWGWGLRSANLAVLLLSLLLFALPVAHPRGTPLTQPSCVLLLLLAPRPNRRVDAVVMLALLSVVGALSTVDAPNRIAP